MKFCQSVRREKIYAQILKRFKPGLRYTVDAGFFITPRRNIVKPLTSSKQISCNNVVNVCTGIRRRSVLRHVTHIFSGFPMFITSHQYCSQLFILLAKKIEKANFHAFQAMELMTIHN